jgi:hypothetical protein
MPINPLWGVVAVLAIFLAIGLIWKGLPGRAGWVSRAKKPKSYWVLMGLISAAILACTWAALTFPAPVNH